MKTTKIVLFVSAFLTSIVKGVEVLTVVLATGTIYLKLDPQRTEELPITLIQRWAL